MRSNLACHIRYRAYHEQRNYQSRGSVRHMPLPCLLVALLWRPPFLAVLITLTVSVCPPSLICADELSDARQISSVFFKVNANSRSSLSRTLWSLIPNTRRSRNISSGVMVENSHHSASLRSAVRYWSYDSPASCVRLLMR